MITVILSSNPLSREKEKEFGSKNKGRIQGNPGGFESNAPFIGAGDPFGKMFEITARGFQRGRRPGLPPLL